MTESPGRRFEFDDTQNATFAKAARAMMFVAITILLMSALVGAAAVVLSRSTLAVGAILAPLAIAAAIMGAQLLAAARRFRRIVATRGNDIGNLMAALEEIAVAYGVQRWLWLSVLIAIGVALAFTIVGR